MIKEVYLIGNYIEGTSVSYDSYDAFIMAIHNLEELEWQQSSFHVITYDEEYVVFDIGMDGEVILYDKETGEDLNVVVYEGKYNHNKCMLFVLDKEYIRFLFRKNN